MNREPIPRLPVFGWQALAGPSHSPTPCVLGMPGLHYTTSGRAAILLALETLAIGPGDTVLLPSYHCPTMVAPAASLGAEVGFYPIDEFGAPRLDWLDQHAPPGARALLAPHYFGLPQPMAALRRWCSQRRMALIEDCAHALFGRSGERPIGAWGDLAIASLTKFLPVPEGGCLIVNNGLDARVPELGRCGTSVQLRAALDIAEVGAVQGRLTGLNGLIAGSLGMLRTLRGGAKRFADSALGLSSLPDFSPGAPLSLAEQQIDHRLAHRRLSAASRWVSRSMPKARIVQARRRHYEWLATRLAGKPGLRPLRPQLPGDCAPYVFPLWVDSPDPGYAELRRLRMPVFRWDRTWPDMPVLPGDAGPAWSHHVLQLACHQDLSEADLENFVAALLRLYAS